DKPPVRYMMEPGRSQVSQSPANLDAPYRSRLRHMKSELIPLMAEIRNWLAGSYGPLPAGVTLLIKPAEFETAVLGSLSDEEVARRERILLGEARRVINQLMITA